MALIQDLATAFDALGFAASRDTDSTGDVQYSIELRGYIADSTQAGHLPMYRILLRVSGVDSWLDVQTAIQGAVESALPLIADKALHLDLMPINVRTDYNDAIATIEFQSQDGVIAWR